MNGTSTSLRTMTSKGARDTDRAARRGRPAWARAVVALVCLFALGCTRSVSSGNGGNTSWLTPCDEAADCVGQSLCVAGTCLASCSSDATCEALTSRPWLLLPTATCDEPRVLPASDDPECAAAPRRVCAPACGRDADCENVGAEYRCEAGVCRAATCTPSDGDMNRGGTGSGPMSMGGTDGGGLTATCVFEGQTYEVGETYQDDCNECTCEDDGAVCTELACGTCREGGFEYFDGETFDAGDGCNECECTNTGVSCTSGPCPAGCVSNGEAYEIGDSIPGDDCNPRVCTARGWEESNNECVECDTDDDCDESAPYCSGRCGGVTYCGVIDLDQLQVCVPDECESNEDCASQMICVPDGCDGLRQCVEEDCVPAGPVCGCDGARYESDCEAKQIGIAHQGSCLAPELDDWEALGCQCNVEAETAMLSLPCYRLLKPFVPELEELNQPEEHCSIMDSFSRAEGCGRIQISHSWDGGGFAALFDSTTGEVISQESWVDPDSFEGLEPGVCGVYSYYGGEVLDCPTATWCSLCRGEPNPCPEAACDPDAGTCP